MTILWLGLSKEGDMKTLACIATSIMLVVAFAASTLAETPSEDKTGKPSAAESEMTVKIDKAKEAEMAANPQVLLETNYGNIKLELFKKEAPISVDNFLSYVREGFYDNTIFHRVVTGFVLQAGGMTEEMDQKKQKAGIKNEAKNGLSNKRGTLSMARTQDINSGTSHFFINLVDNTRLDHRGEDGATYGYAVFGKVIEGMDIVDKIADVKVTNKGMHKNVPAKPVLIKKAEIIQETEIEKKAEKAAEAEKAVERKTAQKKTVEKEMEKAEKLEKETDE
jgi:cyclophilin family peptidyl-prolyl cis-trans isomerase